jgi:pimeloyl-ACP methyl ester carboxylesterase
MIMKHTHRRGARGLTLVVATALLTLMLGVGASADTDTKASSAPKPTIVIVHGAFADGSGWHDVTERLQRRGFTVITPANPLRSLAGDSAYLASILDTIEGPIVLVGHSYGGAVITNAALGHGDVKALVYIAAFAPDEGETLGQLLALNPGSQTTPENLIIRPYPGGVDAYINPAVFRQVFAADVPARETAVMASAQRPLDPAALGAPSGPAAWKTIPSWYLVAKNDNAIPPATERFMAQRAGSHTVEVKSSHVAMISQPDDVSDLIRSAVRATS